LLRAFLPFQTVSNSLRYIAEPYSNVLETLTKRVQNGIKKFPACQKPFIFERRMNTQKEMKNRYISIIL